MAGGPPADPCPGDVDLEALAGAYRHRPATDAELDHAARPLRGDDAPRPGEWGIDVGGGPGAHAAVWMEADVRAVVVDPSPGMLRAAARRGVRAVAGRSQALPFRDRSVALVYFHLSLHFGDWRTALAEAARVLRPGGRCWIWTMGPEHFRTSFLARWFPSVPVIDGARFPDPDGLVAGLGVSGLALDDVGFEVEAVSRPAGGLLEAIRAGFISTLQLIPPEELAAGIAALDAAYPDPDETVHYSLRYERIVARRPLP